MQGYCCNPSERQRHLRLVRLRARWGKIGSFRIGSEDKASSNDGGIKCSQKRGRKDDSWVFGESGWVMNDGVIYQNGKEWSRKIF